MGDSIEFKACLITKKRAPEYGDSVPPLSDFGNKPYWYIEWIYVPKALRRNGEATRLMTNFCKHKKRPIVVYLMGGDNQGVKMEGLFRRLGFRVAKRMYRPFKILDMQRRARHGKKNGKKT